MAMPLVTTAHVHTAVLLTYTKVTCVHTHTSITYIQKELYKTIKNKTSPTAYELRKIDDYLFIAALFLHRIRNKVRKRRSRNCDHYTFVSKCLGAPLTPTPAWILPPLTWPLMLLLIRTNFTSLPQSMNRFQSGPWEQRRGLIGAVYQRGTPEPTLVWWEYH